MPAWVNESFEDYNRRLPNSYHIHLKEITPAIRSKNRATVKNIVEEEKKIVSAVPANSMIIALDEKGKQFTSTTLAGNIEKWIQQKQNLCFIIGGADGLAENFKKTADVVWSLSQLTLPHGLARVMVAEQIYRAWSILNNHPYHRE